MTRLILVLFAALLIGGAGAIYVWTTINELFLGEVGWARTASAVVVFAAMLVLLRFVLRFVNRWEVPK